MPSHSEKQRRFFGLVRAVQKGEKSPHEVSPSLRKVAKSISAKDASDFASSVAETKQKKMILSILKEIQEPMYLNEVEINPVAKTFTQKGEFEQYVRKFLGQQLSPKESEAINTFEKNKPTKIDRTEIRYETTDNFNHSTTTVIKKLREGNQFVFTAFTKHSNIKSEEELEKPTEKPEGVPDQSPNTTEPSASEKPELEDIIVTKSQSFNDEIKGGAILAEFLKKLDL